MFEFCVMFVFIEERLVLYVYIYIYICMTVAKLGFRLELYNLNIVYTFYQCVVMHYIHTKSLIT